MRGLFATQEGRPGMKNQRDHDRDVVIVVELLALPDEEVRRVIENLSEPAFAVLDCVRRGWSNKKIGRKMKKQPGTIGYHIRTITQRAGIPDGPHPQVDIVTRFAGLKPQPRSKRRCGAVKLLASLTQREGQVVKLAIRNLSDEKMGSELGIRPDTVQKHLNTVYKKLKLSEPCRIQPRLKNLRLQLAVWCVDNFFPQSDPLTAARIEDQLVLFGT